MIPDHKKPFRVKYIFRKPKDVWRSPAPKPPQVFVAPDLSKLPHGMSFDRLDLIIRQRAGNIQHHAKRRP